MHCGRPSEVSLLDHYRKEEKDIPRLIDNTVDQCLGPKRTSRIQKLFNLTKEDDILQSVIRKSLNKECKKPRTKATKIQSPDMPCILQAKYQWIAL